MEDISIWLSPLLLMPGVGMLILSTSARYEQIHNEVHLLMDQKQAHHHKPISDIADELMSRSTKFRNALVSLYLSIALLGCAGLSGALTATTGLRELSFNVVICLTAVGIFCLVLAAFFLIRESFHSLDIIREHYDEIKENISEEAGN